MSQQFHELEPMDINTSTRVPTEVCCSCKKLNGREKCFATSMVIMGLVLLVFVGMFVRRDPSSSDSKPAICLTAGCVQLAADVSRSVDTTVDPCTDFFQYACGNWNKRNPIPEDKSRWGTFSLLNQENELVLRNILENVAAGTTDENDATHKARTFYAACENINQIDARGHTPVLNTIQQVAQLVPVTENGEWTQAELLGLEQAIASLHLQNIDVFFGFGVGADDKNSSKNAIFVQQGGLGLPSPDYYNKTESDAFIVEYKRFIGALFALSGITDAGIPQRVFDFEKQMAAVSAKRDTLRDPEKTYNPKTIAQLSSAVPLILWDNFFHEIFPGKPVDEVIVNVPTFFTGLNALMSSTAAQKHKHTLVEYMQWHVLLNYATHLSSDFRHEVESYNRVMTGAATLPPRWQTCVSRTDSGFGFVLGKMFIDAQFSGDSKTTAMEMVNRIKVAFESNLPNLQWMDETTRAAAIFKAEHVVQKIGYPDFINDPAKLNAYYQFLQPQEAGQYFEWVVAIRKFEVLTNLADYGKAVDRSRWDMSPPTVNAYYNPSNNEIVFPAGIMQAPFFDKSYPKAYNFGGMGVVMGHELTHGFDDQGAEYDAFGNLQVWWNNQSITLFKEATQCVANQYSQYHIATGDAVNGVLTLGENIADNGGLKAAFHGYQAWVQDNGAESTLPGLSYTSEQLFFLGFAQVWCGASRPQEQLRLVRTDPHSPGNFRVIGTVSNSDDFAAAFKCNKGTPMNPTNKCAVW